MLYKCLAHDYAQSNDHQDVITALKVNPHNSVITNVYNAKKTVTIPFESTISGPRPSK